MIKSNKGEVTIHGETSEIMSDLTIAIVSVVKALTEAYSKEFALENVKEAYTLGLMDAEEANKYVANRMAEMINEFLDEGDKEDE